MSISKAERIKLRMLENQVTETVRSDSKLVDLIRTILKISKAFMKMHNRKFISTCNVDNLKDIMGSDFLKAMSAITITNTSRAAKVKLRHESDHSFLDNLNNDDAWFTLLGISHLDDNGLYKVTTNELPISIKAAQNFLETRISYISPTCLQSIHGQSRL